MNDLLFHEETGIYALTDCLVIESMQLLLRASGTRKHIFEQSCGMRLTKKNEIKLIKKTWNFCHSLKDTGAD